MITLFTQLSGNNVPQRLTYDGTSSNQIIGVTFFGFSGWSGAIPLSNNGTVYIGLESGKLPIVLGAGAEASWTQVRKSPNNLSNFWFQGNSGDGIYVLGF